MMQTASESWSITIPTLKDNLIARKKVRPDPQPESKPSQPQQPDKQPEKEQPECEEETPRCTTCRYVKSRTCGSKIPGLSCRKPPPVVLPSVASLSQSVGANCRYCCCTIGEFLKEIYKSVQGDPKTRVCDVLADLSDIFLAILTDCVLLIRRIGCTITCAFIRRSHKYTALAKDKLVQKIRRSKSLSLLGDKLKSPNGLPSTTRGDKSKSSTIPSEKSKSSRKSSNIRGDRAKSQSVPGRKSKTRFIRGDRSKTWSIPDNEDMPVGGLKSSAVRKSFRKNESKSSTLSQDDESVSSNTSDDGLDASEDARTEKKKSCCKTKKCKKLKCCLRRYLK